MANTRSNRRILSQSEETRLPSRGTQHTTGTGLPPQGSHQQGNTQPTPLDPQQQMETPPGTSHQTPPPVPWEAYEALRQQHTEGMQALRDMVGILQSAIPNVTLPASLAKFMPESHLPGTTQPRGEERNSHKEVTPDTYSQSSPHQENQSKLPPSRLEQGQHYQRDRQSLTKGPMMDMRDDMKKVVEEVLEQRKLVPIMEKQPRRKSPLAENILEKSLPRKFKMPQLPLYAGKDDPDDHIQNYESLMMLHGWDDEIMCRAFPLTLTGHARTWFNGLPESSISSFEQLSTEFVKAFVINSRKKKTATHLLSIRQGGKETLRQFVDRFRNTTLEIHDLPLEMAISAMLQGTRVTSLQESLSLDPPSSLADLFTRANKYILHTEVMQTVRMDEDKDRKRKERDMGEDRSRRQERTRRPDIGPQFNHYARLLEPRSTILAAVEGSGLIKFPRKVDRPMGRYQNEYCRYHRAYGHATDLCRDLKNKIEMLIRDGHLQKYVRRDDEGDKESQKREGRLEGPSGCQQGQPERGSDYTPSLLQNEPMYEPIR